MRRTGEVESGCKVQHAYMMGVILREENTAKQVVASYSRSPSRQSFDAGFTSLKALPLGILGRSCVWKKISVSHVRMSSSYRQDIYNIVTVKHTHTHRI